MPAPLPPRANRAPLTRALLLLVLPWAALTAQPNTLTPEERAAGWKLLFDGHSFQGWRDPAKQNPPNDGWSIEDGALRTRPNPKIKDDLITEELFENFELTFEWRVDPGHNGGVKYLIQSMNCWASSELVPRGVKGARATQRTDVRPGEKLTCNNAGLEYQLVDDQRHRDGKDPLSQSGSIYKIAPALSLAARPAGEWNQSRIVLRANTAEHWLNGRRVAHLDLESDALKQRLPSAAVYWIRVSPIALQHHNDTAAYRSLKIRTLPD